jgi:hypothetical protein
LTDHFRSCANFLARSRISLRVRSSFGREVPLKLSAHTLTTPTSGVASTNNVVTAITCAVVVIVFFVFAVESSARDALNRGFYSVLVSDCVSSPYKDGHDRSLENMKNLVTIINSKELDNVWLKLRGKTSI